MVDALDVMHNWLGLAHCDFKLENVVVEDLQNGNCDLLLIDFGSTQDVNKPLYEPIGTKCFMAPEVLKTALNTKE